MRALFERRNGDAIPSAAAIGALTYLATGLL